MTNTAGNKADTTTVSARAITTPPSTPIAPPSALANPGTSTKGVRTVTTKQKQKRSLFQLIGDIPTLVTDLVKGEIDQLKAEMIIKLKALGIGGGILAAAALVLLFMFGVLLTAAILALSLVMPGWLAALLVALLLLIIAVVLGLIGYRKLKGGLPPVPEKTIKSVKRDINTVKGMGK